MQTLASVLANIGAGVAEASTSGCFILIADEPKMPKNLLNR